MDHDEIRRTHSMIWFPKGKEPVRRGVWARLPMTHILFFLATLATTTFCGALLHNVNLLQEPWKFYQGFPSR